MTEHRKGIYLITLCCLTYGAAYMCRINLSGVVAKMAAGMQTDVATISILGSIQAVVYAAGQFLNGKFINQFKPRNIILSAALGSGLCNVCMGLVNGYVPALVLWAANAYLQSFLWGAMVRIITVYPESHGNNAIMALTISMSAAYIITWSFIAALLSGTADWHGHFRIPGVILLLTVPLWVTLERICPETGQLQADTRQRSYRQIFTFLWREKVTVYCGVSVLLGALREGILFWTPLILTGALSGTGISSYLMVALVPAVKMLGPVFLRAIVKRTPNYAMVMAQAMLVVAALAGLLALVTDGSTVLTVVLLTGMTLFSCLIGPIISAYIPLDYAADSMSAPVSGVLDAMVYLGASASTYLLGRIITSDSLTNAAWYWMIVAILSALLSLMAARIHYNMKLFRK